MNTRKTIKYLDGKLNTVGSNIQEIRTKQKLSRENLSAKLMILGVDISAQSIFDIETGIRTVVDYELCAISKVLNTTTDNLLKDFKEYLDK